MNLLRDQSAVLRTGFGITRASAYEPTPQLRCHSQLAYPQGMSRGSLRRALQLDLLVTVPVRVTVAFVMLVLCMMASPVSATTFAPRLDIGKGGQCVEDVQWMRKNHMHLLRHQRDETVRKGVREKEHSLKNCIECHASTQDDSVIAREDSFCVACHRYEAVKIDCFECHSGTRKSAWLQRNLK